MSTNNIVSFFPVDTWYDGTPMTDGKVDGVVYVKQQDNKYYRRSLPEHGQQFLIKENMAAMKATAAADILLLKMGYYKGIELSGYVDAGDKPALFYTYNETNVTYDDDGYIVALSDGHLVAGITEVYPEIWGCGISSLWQSHETTMQYAVDFCKNNAMDLHLSARDYVCSLNISWCLPPDHYTIVKADPSYDPADIHQATFVGRSFNVIGCPGAKIRGNVWLDRCREMEVSNILLYGNHITTSCHMIKFTKIVCINREGSLAYYSSDPADPMYPQKYFLKFNRLLDGGSYWIDYDNCLFQRGFVLGGRNTVATNVVRFSNCVFSGSGIDNSRDDYRNTHGAGLYIDMINTHTDGITLINCDLSYNQYPLWNNTDANGVTMIGCYYEECANDFITKDGVKPAPTAANIINGHDFDRHWGNQRIGLRATRWALHANRNTEDNYAKLIIGKQGGAVTVEDDENNEKIGAIVNRIGSTGYGSTITYEGNSTEFNDQRATFLMGGRTFRNWNNVGTVQRFSVEGTETKTLTFTATNPTYVPTTITGNVWIRLTLVGGTIGEAPYAPIHFEGYCTIAAGTAPWSDITVASGALEHAGFACTVTGITKSEIRISLSHKLGGKFSGTVYCECIADVAELDTNGNTVNWALYNY